MRKILRSLPAVITALAITVNISGQADPDPNSPAPMVIAIKSNGRSAGREIVDRRQTTRVEPGSTMTLLLNGLELMPFEGQNSFRVFLRQKSGKTFELQNTDLSTYDKDTLALSVRIFDRHGFRGQPSADGESLVYLTWRGLMSNVVKINIGKGDRPIDLPSDLASASQFSNASDAAGGYRWSGDRKRFLEQATFGPSSLLDSRLRRIGLRTWLAEQFEAPYPSSPYPNITQMPTTPPSNCTAASHPACYREHYTMMPLQKWFFLEAMYGEAQLRHRVAWALSQIWVTSGVGVQQASHQIAYYKMLGDNAFGNYRSLMEAATLNPAMGHYLDMARSTRTNPNENYPREILQLFSIGLYKLNLDGTVQLDNNGNPIETYDQDDVNNFTKVFTGWTFCNITCENSRPGIVNYKDPMIVVPGNHDLTAKTLLDYPGVPVTSISECTDCTTPEQTRLYAENSLRAALDNIFHHPNVGPFIGKLLIQHLVTSDPSPAYIERVAMKFNDNGNGVRGDMPTVIRAILLDPEARGDMKTAPRYGKLREPVQLITNLGRIFPARDFSGENISDGALASHAAKLGQHPFYSPTVFNYFSPDYVIPGTTILAPEFEILNTGRAVARTNFLHTFVFEGLTANATDSLRGTSLDISEYLPFSQDDASGSLLLDILNRKMLHSAISDGHRSAILNAIQAVPETNHPLRVRTAIYLIAASSQYQIQR